MAPKLPEPNHQPHLSKNEKKSPNDNDDDNEDCPTSVVSNIRRRLPSLNFSCVEQLTFSSGTFFSSLPKISSVCLRSLAIATVTIYVLNQKHLLPKPMSKVVSKVLFWPTIPITVSRRIGKWTTEVDDAVLIGGAPFGFMKYPKKLAEQFHVRGVVNMCDEYRGPVSAYQRLGIEQLRLPTVDHFEPSVEDLKRAVEFIRKHESQGNKVYVHCRAGHGRSAAAVFAWLLYKEPLADPIDLNEKLCSMRNVRKSLWKQPNINTFHDWLQSGGMEHDTDNVRGDYKHVTRTRKRRSKHKAHEFLNNTNQQTMIDVDNGIGHLGKVFSDEESTDGSSDYDE